MSVLDAIGNTPLVRLRRVVPANGAELWVKLEYLNPTGSLKDRMALAMIEGAERDGLLGAGDTVVEYTGGSTGPSLALVCRAKGYRALIAMADCFSEERFQLLRALGAEVDVVRSLVGGVVARPRRQLGGAGDHRLDVLRGHPAAAVHGLVDGVQTIGDEEAIAMTARLAREEGIFAGVSTGANVVGALRLAERLGREAVVVTLAVDSGFKYLSVSPYADAPA